MKIKQQLFFYLAITFFTANAAEEREVLQKNVDLYEVDNILTAIAIDAEQEVTITPLMRAAYLDNQEEMISLFGQDVDVNEADDCGRTALFFAFKRRNKKALALLVGADADLSKQSKDGFSVLDLALFQSIFHQRAFVDREREMGESEWEVVDFLFSKGDEEAKKRAWEFIARINPHVV